MNTLIYKRTHTGDPDINGIFGIHDCMGRLRDLDFDSVVGIGGISKEPVSYKINGKINWVGCGARKMNIYGITVVSFRYFCLLESTGPELSSIAPLLAKRMYYENTRYILHKYSPQERNELEKIIEVIKKKFQNKFVYSRNDHASKNGCKEKGCGTR